MKLSVTACESAEDYAAARSLFEEYAAGLGFSLCFQGFDHELTVLPQMYGPPGGTLLLLTKSGSPSGCVGIRPLAEETCEMKRLYVREAVRATGAGKRLAEEALLAGKRLGYRRMLLDTVPSMQAAQALYRCLGFKEIPAYYEGPPGAMYMEKLL